MSRGGAGRPQLTPELLVQAYSQGFFPMAEGRHGVVSWYTADPRALLPLHPFHIPRRLIRSLRKSGFCFTHDVHFAEVMRRCADRPDTWINDAMIRAYCGLHERGLAHSIEVCREGRLVGGLYGVHLGAAFFGESIFGIVPDAAKAALAHLGRHLQQQQFNLLEIQMITPLTAQFAPEEVAHHPYLALLADALSEKADWISASPLEL